MLAVLPPTFKEITVMRRHFCSFELNVWRQPADNLLDQAGGQPQHKAHQITIGPDDRFRSRTVGQLHDGLRNPFDVVEGNKRSCFPADVVGALLIDRRIDPDGENGADVDAAERTHPDGRKGIGNHQGLDPVGAPRAAVSAG